MDLKSSAQMKVHLIMYLSVYLRHLYFEYFQKCIHNLGWISIRPITVYIQSWTVRQTDGGLRVRDILASSPDIEGNKHATCHHFAEMLETNNG